MLFATNGLEVHLIALDERRQRALLVALGVVEPLLVHLQKAGIGHRGAGRAEGVPILFTAGQVCGHRVNGRVDHLASHRSPPDERV